MGGPDPLVLSEDSEISHYEELHPYQYLPSRSITHFSMFKDLERQDGSLYATTNADVWRDSSKVLIFTSATVLKLTDPS